MTKVFFTKLQEDAVVPAPAHGYEEDAGADVSSVEGYCLYPGETKALSIGLAVALPSGYEMQIRSRSGLASKHSIQVLNSPATIDPGYRGEIKVILHNAGGSFFKINKGDRIAQIVIAKYEAVEWENVPTLDETARGSGGLGSTGV